MTDALDLWDYRRRVHDMYRRVRDGGAGKDLDRLGHRPRCALRRSPAISHRGQGSILRAPLLRIRPELANDRTIPPVDDQMAILDHSGEGSTRFLTIGTVTFELAGHDGRLRGALARCLRWDLPPVRDALATPPTTGGRYLLDTVKGADLGHEDDMIILDFNYAYHPSCVHLPLVVPVGPPGEPTRICG